MPLLNDRARRWLCRGVSGVALATSLLSVDASAQPLLPPPATSAKDAALADLAHGFQRQQDVFATAESGLSLDVYIKPDDVQLVRDFFAQTASDDFQQVTGKHPISVMQRLNEWGDLGNFGGVASVAVAARLDTLRREGAPAEEISKARRAAIRAARAWHVYGSIGGPGIIARGIRRIRSENPADPPFPDPIPTLVPLRDAEGRPLPEEKDDVWRAPVAPGFEDWIWEDGTSKDQVVGYALAVVWLYDALKDDPEVPADVTRMLADDLLAFARTLKDVAPETGVDLSIRDADGRLTPYHDLNPRELAPGLVAAETEEGRNAFNALLALAVVRAAYHVSGDESLGRWYYKELVEKRGLPWLTGIDPQGNLQLNGVNYSTINMMAIAYAILGRVETDARVRMALQLSVEHAFWDFGVAQDASHVKQAWFDVIYASFASTDKTDVVVERMYENLSGFQPAPAFEREIVNCDAQEVAEKRCVAVDGTTIITLRSDGSGGKPLATEPVPMSVRPDSDFEWRSDPYRVNGGGSTLLDPRGDYLAAYWYARSMDRDPAKNLSPKARPWPPPMEDFDGSDVLQGCGGCGVADPVSASLLLAVAALARRRKARA